MIVLEGASRGFGAGPGRVEALRGVTLTIERGEFAALVGPSGSGKTTLLHLAGLLDEPDAGSVRIAGVQAVGLPEARRAVLRREVLGFVFQHFNLVPVLSAAENVELPLLFRRELLAAERRRRVEEILARVGLADRAGRRPGELSGGERQRVAIARAVAGSPQIVLADEPTAHLDHEAGGTVIDLLRELNGERGITVLYATHDAELLRRADRVVRLRDGRVVDGAA